MALVLIHAGLAALLSSVDALVLGQGFLTLAAAVIAGAVFIPLTVRAAFRDRALAKKRLAVILIYAAAAAGAAAAIRFNNALARRRAQELARSCDLYRRKHGQFPSGLSQLVPEFLPAVPKAKLGFFDDEFEYRGPAPHLIVWTVLPPWGKGFIVLETGRTGMTEE